MIYKYVFVLYLKKEEIYTIFHINMKKKEEKSKSMAGVINRLPIFYSIKEK
jgi:hypothetical protein